MGVKNLGIRKYLFAICAALCVSALLSGCFFERSGDSPEDMLAYVGEDGLYMYYMESKESALIAAGEHIFSPKISPDGKYVYFNRSSDIFVVPVSGGTAALASPDAKFVCFSSGRMISCSYSGGVRAYDPETGVTETLFTAADGCFVDSALISPDKVRLAAGVRYVDVGVDRPEGLYVKNRGLPEPEKFSSESICGRSDWLVEPLCWSSDGGALLLACGAAGEKRPQLFSLPVIEGASSLLGGKNVAYKAESDYSVSSDGSHAAFLTYRYEEDELETICVVDLTKLRFSYIPSGFSGVSGTAVSSDGSVVAYTAAGNGAGDRGVYVYANDNTICVVESSAGTEYAAPLFSANDSALFFVGWGERLLAETDADGNAVGTYTAVVASVYTAAANTSGCTRILDGLKFPDGVYTGSWYDMYDFFEYIPEEQR